MIITLCLRITCIKGLIKLNLSPVELNIEYLDNFSVNLPWIKSASSFPKTRGKKLRKEVFETRCLKLRT